MKYLESETSSGSSLISARKCAEEEMVDKLAVVNVVQGIGEVSAARIGVIWCIGTVSKALVTAGRL